MWAGVVAAASAGGTGQGEQAWGPQGEGSQQVVCIWPE